MRRMRRALLVVLALGIADTVSAAALTLELRIFDGIEDVTSQTRVTVHRAGERSSPVVQLVAGPVPLAAEVPPGIYDVQAIRERDGRVVSIRWAQRLVVMAYPDERGRHLEVLNFQNGFGALEIRRRDQTLPDAGLYASGEHSRPIAMPLVGSGYLLFVVRAGAYDLQTREAAGATWHSALEVPLDRTRFWIVP
jgi:hypothetical protein